MNKIIIALGLTLAASTGTFAASPNDYVELNAPSHGPAAHYAVSGIDYTTTASFDGSKAGVNHSAEDTSVQFNR